MAVIEIATGDVVDADVEALVNTVNCVGVMGRGVALRFKQAFPTNYREYRAVCDRRELRPGRMFVHATGRITNPHYVINFPTKDHWKGRSQIGYIDDGLAALVEEIRRLDIHSIALPPLGCGLGGLDWDVVRPKIEKALQHLTDLHVVLYEPVESSVVPASSQSQRSPKMTRGRAVLLELIQRYRLGLMEPWISLLEIHKLMYLMQEAGEDLKLRFVQAPYGPYAENLNHALRPMDGHFLTGATDFGDAPGTRIEPTVDGLAESAAYMPFDTHTSRRIERLSRLIRGFETPFGMELLATVHWAGTRMGAADVETAIRLIYQWNERKRQFEERQIRIAWDALVTQGWVNPTSPPSSAE
jgi:O-acetyl-ADP-ribose deacetylase (regulator of RNase III)